MTNNQHDFEQFGDPTETKLLLLMQGVDNSRAAFLLESSRFRSLPTAKYLKSFLATVTLSGQALSKTVEHIVCDINQDTPEVKALLITQLLTEDDTKRVEHFNELLAVDDFEIMDLIAQGFPSYIVDIIEAEGEDEETAQALMKIYFEAAEKDFVQFVHRVGETDSAKRIQQAKTVGKHALEIVKYSAAAGFGAWYATRKLQK